MCVCIKNYVCRCNMNIVSWNCNGAFRHKYSLLKKFAPDVAVVQESESPQYMLKENISSFYDDCVWDGSSPSKGLGIFTFHGFKADIADFYNKDFQFVLPVFIHRDSQRFLLVAVWTRFVGKMSDSYIAQAYQAVCSYEKYFDDETIIMGDFNSNAMWDGQFGTRVQHADLVQKLENDNFCSLYHVLKNEEQGQESQPTQFQFRHKEKAYHIDYMFINKDKVRDVDAFDIGKYRVWAQVSDHMPLFMNVRDAAYRRS